MQRCAYVWIEGGGRRRRCVGFSLLEVTIVLVVIALIAGGVLVGRDLIEGARIRSVISQIERYNVAVHTFRSKYICLPGDCADALKFGLGDATCPDPYVPPYGFPFTNGGCNGDGNGALDNHGAAAVNHWYLPEFLGFWFHLSQAKLIEGAYDGVSVGGTGSSPTPRVSPSSPSTSLPKVGIFTGDFNSFYIGISDTAGTGAFTATLLGRYAFAIDAKFDDGFPLSGRINSYFSPPAAIVNCWRPPFATPVEYNITADIPGCFLWMPIRAMGR